MKLNFAEVNALYKLIMITKFSLLHEDLEKFQTSAIIANLVKRLRAEIIEKGKVYDDAKKALEIEDYPECFAFMEELIGEMNNKQSWDFNTRYEIVNTLLAPFSAKEDTIKKLVELFN